MLPLCFGEAVKAMSPRFLRRKLCHVVLEIFLERLGFDFKFLGVLVAMKFMQPSVRPRPVPRCLNVSEPVIPYRTCRIPGEHRGQAAGVILDCLKNSIPTLPLL